MQHGCNTFPMLPTVPAYVRVRTVKDGSARYDVLYRAGGRYVKVQHAGTFRTRREANLRKRAVEDWLAQGLHPRVELARAIDPALTVEQAGVAWLKSRRSISDSTRTEYERRVERLARDFAGVQAAHLTPKDVNAWLDGLTLAPTTVREYLSTLRAVLDVATDDNPARHRSVELPRARRDPPCPPDAERTLAALTHTHPRFRPLLVLIEQTGLRVSEACAARPADVDGAGSRLLVRLSKTGVRWVPVPQWLVINLYAILAEASGANRQTAHNALKAGCRAAKVEPFGPHALRHRRGSLWSAQHVAPAQAAAWLGHSVQTYTQTYTHVIDPGEIAAHRLAALL